MKSTAYLPDLPTRLPSALTEEESRHFSFAPTSPVTASAVLSIDLSKLHLAPTPEYDLEYL